MKKFTDAEMEALEAGAVGPLRERLRTADIVPTPDPESQREEWLNSRRAGIGGSDVAPILGISKWAGPHEIWEDKTGRKEHSEDRLRFRLGRALEPFVLEEFERTTGLRAISTKASTFVRRDRPWARASDDALVFDGNHLVGVLEGKTAGIANSNEWNDGVPLYYQPQGQHYPWVIGLPRTWFGVLFLGRTKFEHHLLPKDEEDCQVIAEAGEEFWELVEKDTPPPPDGTKAATNFRADLYRAYEDQNTELTREQFRDVLHFHECCQRIKEFEKEKERLSAVLMEHVGKFKRGIFEFDEDRKTKATVVRRKQRLRLEEARKKNPDLLEKYTRTRDVVDVEAIIDKLAEEEPAKLIEFASFREKKLLDKLRAEEPEVVEAHTTEEEYVDEDSLADDHWMFFSENSDIDGAYVRLYGDDPEPIDED